MQFRFALILLSSISQTIFVTCANTKRRSGSVRNGVERPIKLTERGRTFVRKTKKEKSNKNAEKEKGQIDESDLEDATEMDFTGTEIALENNSIEADFDTIGDQDSISPTPSTGSIIPRKRISALAFDSEGDDWNHGTTAVTSRGTITFQIPETTKVGDTLFLFLSRTDHLLPLKIDEWNRGAECFKTHNKQNDCMRAAHCIERDGPYCLQFLQGDEVGNGQDLSTVVFYRQVTEEDSCEWTVDLPGRAMAWALVTAIPDVNQTEPILRVSGTSCDVEWESVFPSVYGEENDILLLSQSFDDRALKNDFMPPAGTDLLNWTNSKDEAGFLFGKKLNESGLTGEMITGGNGGPKCKDALLSVVVNRGE